MFFVLVITVFLLGIVANYFTSLKVYILQVFLIIGIFYFLYQDQLFEDVWLLISFISAIIIRLVMIPRILKDFMKRTLKRLNEKTFFFGRIYHLLLLVFVLIGSYLLSLKILWKVNFIFMGAMLVMFSWLINFVSHKKIIWDVLSFLEVENWVFLLSLLVITYIPFYLEFGIIIDIVMSVLILVVSLIKIKTIYGEKDVEVSDLQNLVED